MLIEFVVSIYLIGGNTVTGKCRKEKCFGKGETRQRNTVLVEVVGVPADCISCRNSSS
jgi:hypothetical protein